MNPQGDGENTAHQIEDCAAALSLLIPEVKARRVENLPVCSVLEAEGGAAAVACRKLLAVDTSLGHRLDNLMQAEAEAEAEHSRRTDMLPVTEACNHLVQVQVAVEAAVVEAVAVAGVVAVSVALDFLAAQKAAADCRHQKTSLAEIADPYVRTLQQNFGVEKRILLVIIERLGLVAQLVRAQH